MLGDPREVAESRLLAKLVALGVADGLPTPFALVTRELTSLASIGPSQLPAALIQLEEQETTMKLGGIVEVNLPGRIILCFAASTVLSSTTANAYRSAVERMLANDIHLGGVIDAIYPTGTLLPAVWQEIGLPATGVLFRMSYEYDARQAALVA